MEATTISTTAPKAVKNEKKPENWEFSIEVDMPETVVEWVGELGEDQLAAYATKQYRIDHQNVVRRMAEAGKTDDEILAVMTTWKPGDRVEVSTADAATTARNAFMRLSPEARQEFLNTLRDVE